MSERYRAAVTRCEHSIGRPPVPFTVHTPRRDFGAHGIWYGVLAYVLWGLTPLYWNLIERSAASPLLHRIVWSVPILLLIVTARGQWVRFREGYSTWKPRITTTIAALLLTVNWGTYVWAVTNGHIVEASLGYFINPLVSVALGVVVLKEQLKPLQWLAVGIATIGVVLMGLLAGVPPWISLVLAFSFGLYGLLKKRDETPSPVVSLFGETLVLFLPALILLVVAVDPADNAFGSSPTITAFFIGAGFVTVVPLLLFGASAQRIPLSMLGFLQYIAPTLQLVVGVVVFSESITRAELLGLTAVWLALAIFTSDRYRSLKDARNEYSEVSGRQSLNQWWRRAVGREAIQLLLRGLLPREHHQR
jgi:chloramphenicol-sensitive protein RarD